MGQNLSGSKVAPGYLFSGLRYARRGYKGVTGVFKGLSLREESNFISAAPALEPAQPRQVESLVQARLIKEIPGGALLEASTTGGLVVSLQIRLVGSRETFHCRLRAADAPAEARLVLARDLPVCEVKVQADEGELLVVGAVRTVRVELEPVRISVRTSGLCLEEDRATEDASGRVVALPLGFTRLASGALAYHDSFVAEPDEHFWGLGERFTSFDKRGQLVSCWNYDALGTQSSQTYKNVPFMLSSRGYGCFVDTTANIHFDCCHSSQAFWSVVVPDEELDYYFVFGGPKACLRQYQELVGGPGLPPAWALGAWVSTGCLPASQDDVRVLVDRFDAEDVPFDVLHLDAFWQTFGCWSDLRWDPERFPEPARLLSEVTHAGLRTCLWVNPYIGPGSPVFAAADQAGYFLKRPDGSSYVGDLWGGYHPAVAVIDITNPGARAWWGAQLAERVSEGAAVFKTDFGEAIPVDVVAYNGMSGSRLHNAYCLLYNDFVTSVMRQAGTEARWSGPARAGPGASAMSASGPGTPTRPGPTWPPRCGRGFPWPCRAMRFGATISAGSTAGPSLSSTSAGRSSGCCRLLAASTVRRPGLPGTTGRRRWPRCEP